MMAVRAAVCVTLVSSVLLTIASTLAHSQEETTDAAAVDDWYYPQEEPAERAALKIPSLLDVQEPNVVFASADDGQPIRVPVGGELDGWRVAETLAEPEPIVVIERECDRWGLILFLGKGRIVAEVRKAIGRLQKICGPKVCFPESYAKRLMESKEDILAGHVLASQEDPSYATVAQLLPPLHMDWSIDTPKDTYTFIGTPESPRKYAVGPDGSIGFRYVSHRREPLLQEVHFEPSKDLPKMAGPVAAKRGLLGGYLPTVNFGFFDTEKQFGWELCVLVGPDEPAAAFARVRRTDGQVTFHQINPQRMLKDGKAFFAALLKLHLSWKAFLERGMQLRIGDRRVMDATRAAIVRAMSSYANLHPKYGLGAYWRKSAEGFPPPTISFNTCLLDWAFCKEAEERIGYYLDHFVKPDGTLDFYGTAVSEYGQLLDLIVKCARQSGDMKWFDARRESLDRIVEHLFRLRAVGIESRPRDAVTHGLLYGSPESDTRKATDYYFSGNVWTWRGLLELGKLYVELGRQRDAPELAERGKRLLAECDVLREDILRAVDRSIVREGERPFLPPIAGHRTPFKAMWESTLSTYTNYRYWLETISAGCLSPEHERMMLDYRRTEGGELLSMTRFQQNLLDDWPYWHQARNLLAHDRVDQYLLGYFSHIAHHQTRGTFTSFELVYIDGTDSRRIYDDYCVPSQMTVPLMTRWMLAFEERDRDKLWLCRAVPRAWLTEGLSFHGALTRWGPVGLQLEPADGLRSFTARIALAAGAKPDILLRVRHPERMRIIQCDVDGGHCEEIDTNRELVRLKPTGQTVNVKLTFQPRSRSTNSKGSN